MARQEVQRRQTNHLMAAGAIVVGSATFLVAVTGLLAPLSLAPHAPPRRRAPPARNAADGKGYGSFDASAWESIAPVSPASTPSAAPSSSSSAGTAGASSAGNARTARDDADERGGEKQIMDVEVGKLPTFAFFFEAGGGKPRREDVVGGGNARTCEAKLQNIMASVPPLEGAGHGEGQRGSGVLRGGGLATDDRRDGEADTCAGSARGGGSGGISSPSSRTTTNILEIRSKDDLLRLLAGRRKGQGPVVVMYHAPWCRKCAYLAPVFRRLAAARMPAAGEGQNAASGGDAGDSTSATPRDGPVFCRADVSHPSWGRSVASGAADAISGGTAAVPTAAAAGGGSNGVGKFNGGAAVPITRGGTPAATVGETENEFLNKGSPAMESCDVCMKSGFVPCGECEGKGAVARSSPDGKHTVAATCPVCVGYKRLRCPSCGGKCYMCD